MCRRNQLLGMFLAGLGVGLLIACRVESVFWCSCFGLGGLFLAFVLLQKIRA